MTLPPAAPSSSSAYLRLAILVAAALTLAASLMPAPDALHGRVSVAVAQAAASQPLPVAAPLGIVSPEVRAALDTLRQARGLSSTVAPAKTEAPLVAPRPFDIEPAAGIDRGEGLPEAAPHRLADGNALAGLSQRAAEIGIRVAVAPAQADTSAPAVTAHGFVVIGSFREAVYVEQWLVKFAAWQPRVLPAVVEGVARSRVAVGPFAEADLAQALQQIRAAGVADAWPLKAPVSAEIPFKSLASLG